MEPLGTLANHLTKGGNKDRICTTEKEISRQTNKKELLWDSPCPCTDKIPLTEKGSLGWGGVCRQEFLTKSIGPTTIWKKAMG